MRPSPAVPRAPYARPPIPQPLDLDLRGNEGARLDPAELPPLSADALRRYPDARPLEAALAARWGFASKDVLVTAGADDALDRLCRAVLAPGRRAVLPAPTFEMTERYAASTGAEIVRIPWDGPFPLTAVLAVEDPALVVLTTPNNPTGAVIPRADVEAVIARFPGAVVALDLAYVEYADDDPTELARRHDNVVVLRTFSKAWGLAGLRVGWAASVGPVIGWMRAVGAPYPVSAASLASASARLAVGPPADHVASARRERAQIAGALREVGVPCADSGANFVFAQDEDGWLADGLAGLGIGARRIAEGVRIGCPGDPASTERLLAGIRAVCAPEALLLDVDGVWVDVSDSYDRAILRTCAAFGVHTDAQAVRAIRARGDANDDWTVTWRLLGERVPFEDVKARFEALYQGGLWRSERLRIPPETLRRWADRAPLAFVTGRPRADLDRTLALHGLGWIPAVCREDGPLKPDPWPVREALRRLGVGSAWMLGDTVDDVRAARAAGVVPIGVLALGNTDEQALLAAGAARVWADPLALDGEWR